MSTQPLNILIVDDRAENLLALEAVLKSPEYHLIKASSGREALRYLLDRTCALILMDVQMPGMDGFETASLIRESERSREIPIIFITAVNTEERFVHRGYEAGAVDYVSKPFDPVVLRSKVAVFAELHRSKERLRENAELLREAERKERERALAELELRSLRRERQLQRKYRDLVDGLRNGVIWSADAVTLAFSFVSPSARSILGHVPSELEGARAPDRLAGPEDRVALIGAMGRAVAERREQTIEHRYGRADGRVVWLQSSIRSDADPEGAPGELRGLTVDITALKEAEEARAKAEARSSLMAEASLAFSRSLDVSEIMAELSRLAVPRVADWFWVETFEEKGRAALVGWGHVEASLSERVRELCEAGASRIMPFLRTEEAIRSATPEIHADFGGDGAAAAARELGLRSAMVVPLVAGGKGLGAAVYVSGASGRLYGDDDLKVAEDLTGRLALALENSRLYSKAREAIRARDEFLSIASHELKTPITPLKIQTQFVQRALAQGTLANIQTDKLKRMVESSDRQLNRLTRLVDELLDISRINSGRLELVRERVDLAAIVEDTVERFASELVAARCPVTIHAPAGGARVLGDWDRFRIEQVLVNLMTNAMKYASGSHVRIEVATQGKWASLSVRDQGMGIAQADLERIFDRFERAQGLQNISGLGLGLYIVKEIVTAHGGHVRVESERGMGSCFTVFLPMEDGPMGDGVRHLTA